MALFVFYGEMAKRKATTPQQNIAWNPGEANPKQMLFYQSRTLYTAYGGAKGGGKTHAVRIKAVGGAIFNPERFFHSIRTLGR